MDIKFKISKSSDEHKEARETNIIKIVKIKAWVAQSVKWQT